MEEVKKLLSNSFYLFLDWLLLTAISFLYWLVAGKLLLPSEYGIVSASMNLAFFVASLALLGLNAATWKLISEFVARGKREKIGSLIKFCLKVCVFSDLVVLTTFLLFSKPLSTLFNLPEDAVRIIGFIVLFQTFSALFGMVMYGFQNMRGFLFTDVWAQLSKIITSAILILLGFSYMGPLFGLLFSFLVLTLLRLKYLPFPLKGDKLDYKKIFWVYAIPALISGISWMIFMNGQYVLLNSFRGSEETGFYTIAMLLTNPIITIPRTLNSALLPISSQLYVKKGKRKRHVKLIEMVFRYSLFVAIPLSLFLIIFSKQVIILFSRPEYLPATNFFYIVAAASIVYAIGNLFLNNLYAIGKTKLNRNIVVATTILFLIISPPLIISFGAGGLAAAYLIATIFLLLTSFYFLRRFLEIRIEWKDILKISVASSLASFVVYVIAIHTTGLLMNIIACVIGGSIYLLSLLILKFPKKEDIRLLEMILEKIGINSKFSSKIFKFSKISL